MTTATATANVSPFVTLGTDVSSETELDKMLEKAGAAFTAEDAALTAMSSAGMSDVASHKALVRDDTGEVLTVVKSTYKTIQYREVMEYALDAVNLRPNDAAIENVGVMRNGAQFFATISLGSLFIDPQGVNDEIARYLGVFSSHDGSLAVMLAETNERIACSNQAPSIRANCENKVTVKHTKNAKDRLGFAKLALGIADRAAALFEQQANDLLAVPCNKDTVVRIANKIWSPPADDASEKGKTQHANRLGSLVTLFEGDTCAGAVGENRWAAFNAFTEYLDHGRGTSTEKRALATIVPDGRIERFKIRAGELLSN